MGQIASYLIAGVPAELGVPFTTAQLFAIKIGLGLNPNNYPAWVRQQAERQQAGLPINGPTNVAATTSNINSSGAQVREDQFARSDGSNTVLPGPANLIQTQTNGRVVPPPTQTQPTNAQRYTQNTDAGTNAPVRTITSTQSTPAANVNRSSSPTASRTLGVGAVGQDGAARAGTVAGLSKVFLSNQSKIIPQPNGLGKYASYTYNLSLYIMSPTDYQRTVASARISVPGSQLLIQSGGMPGSSATPTPSDNSLNGVTGQTKGTAPTGAGRNQYFPLDFYIDDFTITNLQPGKGTNSANAVTNMRFKIIEPNGITFLDNLYSACEQYVGKKQNYAAQTYLMVIRFYGYDEFGNLVKADNNTKDIRTDKNALVEKYIPFQFTKIQFRVANQLTEYNCEAVVPGNNQASGQARGVIPYNTEIQAETIAALFGGKAVYNEQQQQDGREQIATESAQDGPGTAPPKANAAPKKTVTGGLVDALNQYEQQHVKDGTFTVADQYEVIFPDPVIANAKTKPPNVVDKTKVAQPTPTTAGQAKNPATNSMNPNAQTKPSVAGMSIIQFIDQAVRTSSYIYEQQTVQYDENNNPIANGSAPKLTSWYRIGVQALPIKYDPKRNDYAYRITYSVTPYLVSDVKSEYFNKSPFRGTHKKYSYWFTGENTEILDYQQEFNNLYYVVVNGNQKPKGAGELDYRDINKKVYQARSQESDQGQDGKINEPGANAATSLYSPTDLSRVKLSIVGDPGWIAQGEIWRNIRAFTYSPFFPDGTINYEIQEPLFEVAWNKPADYVLGTGLLEPSRRSNGGNEIETLASGPTQSYIYRAVSVTSSFKQGKFTQDLEGLLVQFPSTAIKKNDIPLDSDPFSFSATTTTDTAAAEQRETAPATLASPTVRTPTNTTTPVIQPRRGAPQSPNSPPTEISPGAIRQRPSTATVDRFGRPIVQPLTSRAPTSGSQVVGAATPPTNTNATTPQVNTTLQNGVRDY